MSTIASQITSLTIVYSTIYSGADQSKHQSSASLAFVWGIHRGPVNSPHKWPVTRKMFPFDDVIMEMAVVLPRPQCSNQNKINGWFGTEAFADIRLGSFCTYAGINVCMRLANERRRYNVTSSLIGWARTQNYHCIDLCYLTGLLSWFFVSSPWHTIRKTNLILYFIFYICKFGR